MGMEARRSCEREARCAGGKESARGQCLSAREEDEVREIGMLMREMKPK